MLEMPSESQVDPDEIIQGYPWPSSKLTKADMIRLTDLRERLGKPITKLLHDAVGAYYFVLVNETAITHEQANDWYRKLKDVPTIELIAEIQRRERIALHEEMKKPPQAGQYLGGLDSAFRLRRIQHRC